ncbi:MAG: Uma2 family endonuclease [Polyangiaceae bacterium]|nr:Uma2 family endonuclease [Polyangiaceae bacterium]
MALQSVVWWSGSPRSALQSVLSTSGPPSAGFQCDPETSGGLPIAMHCVCATSGGPRLGTLHRRGLRIWHTGERLPRLPRTGPITVVPDWVCEILSPRTRGYDLIVKRRFYAQIGVGHLWYVDPQVRALTVSRIEGGKWLELGTHGADEEVRAEPFEAVEVHLAEWFEGIEPDEDEAGEP